MFIMCIISGYEEHQNMTAVDSTITVKFLNVTAVLCANVNSVQFNITLQTYLSFRNITSS